PWTRPCTRTRRRTIAAGNVKAPAFVLMIGRERHFRLSPSATKPLRPFHIKKGLTISTTLKNPVFETLLEDNEIDLDAPDPRVAADALPASADSLELFLNETGRYPLLTAAEEVALAKRVERGDRAAKERMINSNLRLVVHVAKKYRGHGVPF